jgi:hypothetical protein
MEFRTAIQQRSAASPNVKSKTSTPVMRARVPTHDLQRTIGNSATARLLQPKLAVSDPGDEYEREADHVADQVMRMPDPALMVQRKCACGASEGESCGCT